MSLKAGQPFARSAQPVFSGRPPRRVWRLSQDQPGWWGRPLPAAILQGVSEPTAVVAAAGQVLAHVPGPGPPRVQARARAGQDKEVRGQVPRRRCARSTTPSPTPPTRPTWGRSTPVTCPSGPGRPNGPGERRAPYGEIMPEDEFLGLLAAVDEFDLVTLSPEAADRAGNGAGKPPAGQEPGPRPHREGDAATSRRWRPSPAPCPSTYATATWPAPCGAASSTTSPSPPTSCWRTCPPRSRPASPCCTCSSAHGIDPASIDYVIGCGEEAIGDRYQRGGGNMAKAVAGRRRAVRGVGRRRQELLRRGHPRPGDGLQPGGGGRVRPRRRRRRRLAGQARA